MCVAVFQPLDAEYDLHDQHFSYICKSFLVHVDDDNPQIREACFDFLMQIREYNLSSYVVQLQVVFLSSLGHNFFL